MPRKPKIPQQTMHSTRRRTIQWLAITGLLASILIYIFCAKTTYFQQNGIRVASLLPWKNGNDGDGDGDGKGVNATLRWQKIFVVNLPERTDRRDMFELMAVETGIEVEFVRGVKGGDVPEVAFIPGMNRKASGAGYIGSWRSHLNTVHQVIHDRLSTALIIEDDVDWDIRLKSQVAKLLRAVKSADFTQDWDLLWIGHQGDELPPDDQRHMVIHDPTVPSSLSPGFTKATNEFPIHSRVLHPSDYPLASFAYVLSAAGARKVLYHIGLRNQTGCYHCAFDELLANDCRTHMNCISLTPGLFHDFKAAGSSEKQSLNNPGGWDKERSEEVYSKNIDKSIREHLKMGFEAPVRFGRKPLTEEELSDRFNDVFNDERFRFPEGV